VLVTPLESAPPRAVVAPVAWNPHRRHPEFWVPNLGLNMAEIAPGPVWNILINRCPSRSVRVC